MTEARYIQIQADMFSLSVEDELGRQIHIGEMINGKLRITVEELIDALWDEIEEFGKLEHILEEYHEGECEKCNRVTREEMQKRCDKCSAGIKI